MKTKLKLIFFAIMSTSLIIGSCSQKVEEKVFFFDVLFLPRGHCELPLNEKLYEEILNILNEAFEKNQENVGLIVRK